MSGVRTRFAPSPTGFMHVGGLRTALFAWLVARQSNGEFRLRIEDTDRARHVEQAEHHIIDTLKWLDLNWDGDIYRQSEHLSTYKEWAQKLIDRGRAYADSRSPEELDDLRSQSKASSKPFLYRNFRPSKPPVWDATQPLRLLSEPKNYQWHDEVMGDLSNGPEAIDDFILIKSNGYPTYDFAHIIDDHITGISHVMRSQEFASSIPKFLNLYEALGIEPPKLATLPYVLAPDGKQKLSKRHGAKDALDYKDEGYLAEAIVNFLATLGWNDGTEQEIFSRDELIKKFKLNRVHRAGAHFDEKRLEWMNGHYIRHVALDELYERSRGFWPKEAEGASEEYQKSVLALEQERLKYLSELKELTKFFFAEPEPAAVEALYKNPPDKGLRGLSTPQQLELLKSATSDLSQSNFSGEDIRNRLNSLLEKQQTKPGVLFPLIRIAISGQKTTPELFGTLAVLGKDKSLTRLERALASLEKQA